MMITFVQQLDSVRYKKSQDIRHSGCLILSPKNELFLLFWTVFRSERAVSTIFPRYIMTNGTNERKQIFCDTLPLRNGSQMTGVLRTQKPHWDESGFQNCNFVLPWPQNSLLNSWLGQWLRPTGCSLNRVSVCFIFYINNGLGEFNCTYSRGRCNL